MLVTSYHTTLLFDLASDDDSIINICIIIFPAICIIIIFIESSKLSSGWLFHPPWSFVRWWHSIFHQYDSSSPSSALAQSSPARWSWSQSSSWSYWLQVHSAEAWVCPSPREGGCLPGPPFLFLEMIFYQFTVFCDINLFLFKTKLIFRSCSPLAFPLWLMCSETMLFRWHHFYHYFHCHLHQQQQ